MGTTFHRFVVTIGLCNIKLIKSWNERGRVRKRVKSGILKYPHTERDYKAQKEAFVTVIIIIKRLQLLILFACDISVFY